MIKVLIADDQELIRESLKIILGAHDNIEIVGNQKDEQIKSNQQMNIETNQQQTYSF